MREGKPHEVTRSADRLDVLEKIKEYERNGWFDRDVENDPYCPPIRADEVDFLGKKLSSKFKTGFANFCAQRYFNKRIRQKHYIFSGVTGLENLAEVDGGAIVTCNHMNAFDNYAVYLALKKYYKGLTLYKVIRGGNYAQPGIIGFFMRNCNTLPLSEDPKTLAACIRAIDALLNRGEKVLIYPEQGMWWNYRKPRPFKNGAFKFAAKNNKPVIPCFITLADNEKIGNDGFPVQEYTVNILPVIYPDTSLPLSEKCEKMKAENYELCKQTYERVYGKKLSYNEDE